MATENRTVIDYINGFFPGVTVTDTIIANILFKTGVDAEASQWDLDERQRDLIYAYLILYLTPGSGTSQRVTDRDGDWEHSESTSAWTYSDRSNLLRLARALLKKWGIEDELADVAGGKWGFRGTGFRKIRRNP